MRTLLYALLMMFAASSAGQSVARTTAEEHEVKAAFLLRFVDYVDWPQGIAPADGDLTHICVLGDDPFGRVLETLVQARTSPRRPLRLHHVATAARATSLCHVVYVGRNQRSALRRDLSRLREEAVLTVGDHPAFLDLGGIIAFRIEEDRVRLAVSLAAAEHAGLRISSRLLGLAQVVDER
jgi:hypothetical protein